MIFICDKCGEYKDADYEAPCTLKEFGKSLIVCGDCYDRLNVYMAGNPDYVGYPEEEKDWWKEQDAEVTKNELF